MAKKSQRKGAALAPTAKAKATRRKGGSLLTKARAKIAALEAEAALRADELRLARDMCGGYQRLGADVASSLRLLAEQQHQQGSALTASHLLTLSQKLDPPPQGGEGKSAVLAVAPRAGRDGAGAKQ
jgi:hypothetical protein